MSDLIDKKEAAQMLGGASAPVSISFVNQLLAQKKLPKVRIGHRITRIPRKAVEEYLHSRTIASYGTR